MNCPLKKLLMEMDSQNQDSETAAGMNAAQKEAATTGRTERNGYYGL